MNYFKYISSIPRTTPQKKVVYNSSSINLFGQVRYTVLTLKKLRVLVSDTQRETYFFPLICAFKLILQAVRVGLSRRITQLPVGYRNFIGGLIFLFQRTTLKNQSFSNSLYSIPCSLHCKRILSSMPGIARFLAAL